MPHDFNEDADFDHIDSDLGDPGGMDSGAADADATFVDEGDVDSGAAMMVDEDLDATSLEGQAMRGPSPEEEEPDAELTLMEEEAGDHGSRTHADMTVSERGGADQRTALGDHDADVTFMDEGGADEPAEDEGPDAEMTLIEEGPPPEQETTDEGPSDADMTFMEEGAGNEGPPDADAELADAEVTLIEEKPASQDPKTLAKTMAEPNLPAPGEFDEFGATMQEGPPQDPARMAATMMEPNLPAPGEFDEFGATMQEGPPPPVPQPGAPQPGEEFAATMIEGQQDVPSGPTMGGTMTRGNETVAPSWSKAGAAGAQAGGATAAGRSQSGSGLAASGLSTSGLRSEAYGKTGDLQETGEGDGLYAGKYKLLGELARGGMGVVYKALHVDLNQIVALKVLIAGAYATEGARKRFLFEAQASARLKHPNIVPVYDIGAVDKNLYFTMAFIKGKDLKDRKAELTRDQLLTIMIGSTAGIGYAHQRGIIHRDLKPANIMLDGEDTPMIMDFGLAKEAEDQEKDEAQTETELAQTQEGTLMGTPYYMAPEQADGRNHDVDVRTDLYTMGVILYELWAKKRPFMAKRASEILKMILEKEPLRPREVDPTIDPDLEAVILKAMEKEPEKRYQTAQALKEDLERYRDGLPVSAQRATAIYRLKKWLNRNLQVVAVAAALFFVVVATFGVLTYKSRAKALDAIEQARTQLDSLARDQNGVQAGLEALLSGKGEVSARREQAEALLARLQGEDGLLRELERASGPLEAYVEDYPQRAGKVQEAFADERREATAHQIALLSLAQLYQELDATSEGLEVAQPLQENALAALDRAGVATVASWQDLESGVAGGRALLQEVTEHTETPLPPEYEQARGSLEEHLRVLREHVYSALRLAPSHGPEATIAQRGIEAVTVLEQELAAAEEQVRNQRSANRLLSGMRHLVGLLAQQELGGVDAMRQLRLETAEVARTLIQRALEADSSVPGLEEARLEANRAHAWALIEVKAYKVFDVVFRSPDDFAEEAREVLAAERENNYNRTQRLRDRIERAGLLQLQIGGGQARVVGTANDALQRELMAYRRQTRMLQAMEGDVYLDDELETKRRERLEFMSGRAAEIHELMANEQAAEENSEGPGEDGANDE
jgi:predicted Ser/Thr protein kinase